MSKNAKNSVWLRHALLLYAFRLACATSTTAYLTDGPLTLMHRASETKRISRRRSTPSKDEKPAMTAADCEASKD